MNSSNGFFALLGHTKLKLSLMLKPQSFFKFNFKVLSMRVKIHARILTKYDLKQDSGGKTKQTEKKTWQILVRLYLAGNSVVCNSRLFFFFYQCVTKKKRSAKPPYFYYFSHKFRLRGTTTPQHTLSSALPDEDVTIHLCH